MKLTLKETLENRLKADRRNVNDWALRMQNGQNIRSETLAYLVADCALRYKQALAGFVHSEPPLMFAKKTLFLALDLYQRQVVPSEAIEFVGVGGDTCESGNECGRTGCPNCQD